MRRMPLPEMPSHGTARAEATPMAELARQLRRFADAPPSPARGLVFGLFFSLLLWAAILGFLLAL